MQQCTDCGIVYLNRDLEVCENCGMDAGDYTDIFRSETATLVESNSSDMSGEYKHCVNCEAYFHDSIDKYCVFCGTHMNNMKINMPIVEEVVSVAVIASAVGLILGWISAKSADDRKVSKQIFGKFDTDSKKIMAAIIQFKDMDGVDLKHKAKIVASLIKIKLAISAIRKRKDRPAKDIQTIRNEIIWMAGVLIEFEHPALSKSDLTSVIKGLTKLKS